MTEGDGMGAYIGGERLGVRIVCGRSTGERPSDSMFLHLTDPVKWRLLARRKKSTL